MARKDKREAWAEDVVFVFEETARFQRALVAAKPGELDKLIPKEDFFFTLPTLTGRGQMPCGRAAHEALQRLAAAALNGRAEAGRVTVQRVIDHLKVDLMKAFIGDKRPVIAREVDRVLSGAVKKAARSCEDTTHYFPCHLIAAADPNEFAVGPVRFARWKPVEEGLEPAFARYRAWEEADRPRRQ